MKHRSLALIAALGVTFGVCLGMAGCKPDDTEPEPHEHVYGDWIQGPETHWRECEICHSKFGEITHTYRNVAGLTYTIRETAKEETLPVLHVSAPDDMDARNVYIKKVGVCAESGTAGLRVSYSTTRGGTFASSVEFPADSFPAGSGVWKEVEFSGAGLRLATYSYFRLQAVGGDITVHEIVFLASDEDGNTQLFLLTPEVDGATGQAASSQKRLIDMQQFPNEKQECYLCHYARPKTQA